MEFQSGKNFLYVPFIHSYLPVSLPRPISWLSGGFTSIQWAQSANRVVAVNLLKSWPFSQRTWRWNTTFSSLSLSRCQSSPTHLLSPRLPEPWTRGGGGLFQPWWLHKGSKHQINSLVYREGPWALVLCPSLRRTPVGFWSLNAAPCLTCTQWSQPTCTLSLPHLLLNCFYLILQISVCEDEVRERLPHFHLSLCTAIKHFPFLFSLFKWR